MNTAQIDATNFGDLIYTQPAASVHSTPWRGRTQFWTSATMCCFLVLHGVWLLARVKYLAAESLERSGSVMIAIVYGTMLPSFLYFAWKAWRSKSERPLQSIDDLR